MSNPNEPALPILESDNHVEHIGLTKREYIAIEAMKGLLSCIREGQPGVYYNPPSAADDKFDVAKQWAFIPESKADAWAKNAYTIADAMLKAGEE